eukprot:TRINITY_DN1600_c0_g1_i1.p1 TRINITY_DN1600_c0_g1~~TRINITY_DN1600_c0_g1_i1.p1  ORF type:complete len:2075 (+),score=508.44 TRINITY_DN1600_c0_g1_i1:60-6284(+)
MRPLKLNVIFPTPIPLEDFRMSRTSISTSHFDTSSLLEDNFIIDENVHVEINSKITRFIEVESHKKKESKQDEINSFLSFYFTPDNILWGNDADADNVEFDSSRVLQTHINNSLTLDSCIPSVTHVQSALEQEVSWNDEFVETVPLVDIASDLLVDINTGTAIVVDTVVEESNVSTTDAFEYLKRIGSDSPWRLYAPIVRHINESSERLMPIDSVANCDIVASYPSARDKLHWHRQQFDLLECRETFSELEEQMIRDGYAETLVSFSSVNIPIKVAHALTHKITQRHLVIDDPGNYFHLLDDASSLPVQPIKWASDLWTHYDDLILCEYIEKYPMFLLERGMRMKLVQFVHQNPIYGDGVQMEQVTGQIVEALSKANLPSRRLEFWGDKVWFDRGEIRFILPKDKSGDPFDTSFEDMEESPFFGEFSPGDSILQMQTNLFSSILLKQDMSCLRFGPEIKDKFEKGSADEEEQCPNVPFVDFLLIHQMPLDGPNRFFIRELPDTYVALHQEPKRHVTVMEPASREWRKILRYRVLFWVRSQLKTQESVTIEQIMANFPDCSGDDIKKLLQDDKTRTLIRYRQTDDQFALTDKGKELLRGLIFGGGPTERIVGSSDKLPDLLIPEYFVLQDALEVSRFFWQRRFLLNVPIKGADFEALEKQLKQYLTHLAGLMDRDKFENERGLPHVGLTLTFTYLLETLALTAFRRSDAYNEGMKSRAKIFPTFLDELMVTPEVAELQQHYLRRLKQGINSIQQTGNNLKILMNDPNCEDEDIDEAIEQFEELDYSFSEHIPPKGNDRAKIKPGGLFTFKMHRTFKGWGSKGQVTSTSKKNMIKINDETKNKREDDGRSVLKEDCIELLRNVLNDNELSVEYMQNVHRWTLQARIKKLAGKLHEDKLEELQQIHPQLKAIMAPKKQKLLTQTDIVRQKLLYFTESTKYDILLRSLLNRHRLNLEQKIRFDENKPDLDEMVHPDQQLKMYLRKENRIIEEKKKKNDDKTRSNKQVFVIKVIEKKTGKQVEYIDVREQDKNVTKISHFLRELNILPNVSTGNVGIINEKTRFEVWDDLQRKLFVLNKELRENKQLSGVIFPSQSEFRLFCSGIQRNSSQRKRQTRGTTKPIVPKKPIVQQPPKNWYESILLRNMFMQFFLAIEQLPQVDLFIAYNKRILEPLGYTDIIKNPIFFRPSDSRRRSKEFTYLISIVNKLTNRYELFEWFDKMIENCYLFNCKTLPDAIKDAIYLREVLVQLVLRKHNQLVLLEEKLNTNEMMVKIKARPTPKLMFSGLETLFPELLTIEQDVLWANINLRPVVLTNLSKLDYIERIMSHGIPTLPCFWKVEGKPMIGIFKFLIAHRNLIAQMGTILMYLNRLPLGSIFDGLTRIEEYKQFLEQQKLTLVDLSILENKILRDWWFDLDMFWAHFDYLIENTTIYNTTFDNPSKDTLIRFAKHLKTLAMKSYDDFFKDTPFISCQNVASLFDEYLLTFDGERQKHSPKKLLNEEFGELSRVKMATIAPSFHQLLDRQQLANGDLNNFYICASLRNISLYLHSEMLHWLNTCELKGKIEENFLHVFDKKKYAFYYDIIEYPVFFDQILAKLAEMRLLRSDSIFAEICRTDLEYRLQKNSINALSNPSVYFKKCCDSLNTRMFGDFKHYSLKRYFFLEEFLLDVDLLIYNCEIFNLNHAGNRHFIDMAHAIRDSLNERFKGMEHFWKIFESFEEFSNEPPQKNFAEILRKLEERIEIAYQHYFDTPDQNQQRYSLFRMNDFNRKQQPLLYEDVKRDIYNYIVIQKPKIKKRKETKMLKIHQTVVKEQNKEKVKVPLQFGKEILQRFKKFPTFSELFKFVPFLESFKSFERTFKNKEFQNINDFYYALRYVLVDTTSNSVWKEHGEGFMLLLDSFFVNWTFNLPIIEQQQHNKVIQDIIDHHASKFDFNAPNILKNIVNQIKNHPNAWAFLELLPKDVYPYYYQMIKEPISLKEIVLKDYTNPDDLLRDVELMCNNAHLFNDSADRTYGWLSDSLLFLARLLVHSLDDNLFGEHFKFNFVDHLEPVEPSVMEENQVIKQESSLKREPNTDFMLLL